MTQKSLFTNCVDRLNCKATKEKKKKNKRWRINKPGFSILRLNFKKILPSCFKDEIHINRSWFYGFCLVKRGKGGKRDLVGKTFSARLEPTKRSANLARIL